MGSSQIRKCLGYAAVAALSFMPGAHSQAKIVFFETHAADHSASVVSGPSLIVLNNATTYTCMNLADVISNNQTSGNRTYSGSPVYTLDNITYVRDTDTFDTSIPYTQWYVNQYPTNGNGSTAAAMQVNVYGETDCKNDTDFYLAHSCRESAGGQLDWSALSISFQPNDVNAASCLYNATNGDPNLESETENVAGGPPRASVFTLGAAFAIAFAMVL